MANFLQKNYNEYKYHVSQENLSYLLDILYSLYGGSDPFSEGIVDSIYYDTPDRAFYKGCLEGNADKLKFRIRGYGDGTFNQLHLKEKDIFVVMKRKQKLEPVAMNGNLAPSWENLTPLKGSSDFSAIKSIASLYGNLEPAVRITYKRYRFRLYDYRITLDTRIEARGFCDGKDSQQSIATLPHHVLEVKTIDPKPHLPFLGLIRLPQISFSKFMIGISLLESGDVV